jgi:hypothetical protein
MLWSGEVHSGCTAEESNIDGRVTSYDMPVYFHLTCLSLCTMTLRLLQNPALSTVAYAPSICLMNQKQTDRLRQELYTAIITCIVL